MRTRGGGGCFEDSRFVDAMPTETTNEGGGGKVGPGLLGDGALKAGKSNMRLVARAIREGWPVSDEVKRDLVDQMHLVGTCANSHRNQIAATRVAIEMENANIKREQMALDLRIAKMRQGVDSREDREQLPTSPIVVNVNNTNNNAVAIMESDDWYGTVAANRQLAASDGAPDPDADIAGAVQGDCVRPPLGQNSVGANGHSEGPRA